MLWAAEKGNVDGNGRYTAPETSEDTDDQVTVVCAEDSSVRQIFNVNIRGKKEKVKVSPQKMEVRKVGKNGQYRINIQIVDNLSKGYKCVLVVTDYDKKFPGILLGKKHIQEIQIDDTGFISVPLKAFQENTRCLHLNIKGTDFDKIVYLNGPKPKFNRIVGAGFWKNLFQ